MSEQLGCAPCDIPRNLLQEFASECGKLLAPDEYIEAGNVGNDGFRLVFGKREQDVIAIAYLRPHELDSNTPQLFVEAFHKARAEGHLIMPMFGIQWPEFFVRYTCGNPSVMAVQL